MDEFNSSMQRNVDDVHNSLVDENFVVNGVSTPLYSCTDCTYKTPSLRKLGRHKSVNHAGVKYRCEMCDFVTGYQSNYYRHKKQVHSLVSSHNHSGQISKSPEKNLNRSTALAVCKPQRQTVNQLAAVNVGGSHRLMTQERGAVSVPTNNSTHNHLPRAFSELQQLRNNAGHLGNQFLDSVLANYGHLALLYNQVNNWNVSQPLACNKCQSKFLTNFELQQHLTLCDKKISYHPKKRNVSKTADTSTDTDVPSVDVVESLANNSSKRRAAYRCSMADCEFGSDKSRDYLHHLRDAHDQNFRIFYCNSCYYATRDEPKLARHRSIVHAFGSRKKQHNNNNNGSLAHISILHPDDQITTDTLSELSIQNGNGQLVQSSDKIRRINDTNVDGSYSGGSQSATSGLSDSHIDQSPNFEEPQPFSNSPISSPAFSDEQSKTKLEMTLNETDAIEMPSEQFTFEETNDPDVKKRLCSLCGYTGKWSSEMIRHKRVHTNSRPYRCKYCNRTSKWKADLIRHVQKVHGFRVISKYSRVNTHDDALYDGATCITMNGDVRKLELKDGASYSDSGRGSMNGSSCHINEGSEKSHEKLYVSPTSVSNTSQMFHENPGQQDSSLVVDSCSAFVKFYQQIFTDYLRTVDYQTRNVDHSDRLFTEIEDGSMKSLIDKSQTCEHDDDTLKLTIDKQQQQPMIVNDCQSSSSPPPPPPPPSSSTERQSTTHIASPDIISNDCTGIFPADVEKYAELITTEDLSPPTLSNELNSSCQSSSTEHGHYPTTLLRCKVCLYATRDSHAFKAHVQKHENRKPFQCSSCGYRSNWSSDVHKHIRLKRTAHDNAYVIRLDEIDGKSVGVRLNANLNSGLSMVVIEKTVPDFQPSTAALPFSSSSSSLPSSSQLVTETTTTTLDDDHATKVDHFENFSSADEADQDFHANLNDDENLNCQHCPFRCSTFCRTEYEQHLKNHAKPKGIMFYKCLFCDWYSKKKLQVFEHLKWHDVIADQSHMSELERTLITTPLLEKSQNNHHNHITPIVVANNDGESNSIIDHNSFSDDTTSEQILDLSTTNKSLDSLKIHGHSHMSDKSIIDQHLIINDDVINNESIDDHDDDDDNDDNNHDNGHNSNAINDNNNLATTTTTNDQISIDIQKVEAVIDGQLRKMWQCRFCAHMSKRRANIRMHEKKHFKSATPIVLKCSRCSYRGDRHSLKLHMRCHDFYQNTCLKTNDDRSVLLSSSPRQQEISQSKMMMMMTINEPSSLTAKNDDETSMPINVSSVGPSDSTVILKPYSTTIKKNKRIVSYPFNRSKFPSIKPVASHIRRHYINFKLLPKPKNLKCADCPAQFSERHQFNRHKQFHGASLKHCCPLCNYSVPFPINVIKHLGAHHSVYVNTVNEIAALKQRPTSIAS